MKIEKLIKKLEKYDSKREIGIWDEDGFEIVEICILQNMVLKTSKFDLVIDAK